MVNKREKLCKELIHYIFALWFGCEIISNTNIQTIFLWSKDSVNSIVTLCVTTLLLMQIVLFQSYNRKELFLIGTLSAVFLYTAMNSGLKTMMSVWLFILASKYLDFDKIMIISYILLCVLVILVIYLNMSGFISEKVIYRNGYMRHSLGFLHPNWLGVRFFQIGATHLYLRRKHVNVLDLLFIAGIVIFIYRVPNSQTAYYALSLLTILILLTKFLEYFEGSMRLLSICMIVTFIISYSGSVILSVIDVRQYELLKRIDEYMSYRFSWGHKAYIYYGIGMWGAKIDVYKKVMNRVFMHIYLDNAYMSILIRFGVVVYIVFFAMYLATMIYLHKKKNYILIIVLTVYALYGIMENSFYYLTQNSFLLTLAMPLYNLETGKSEIYNSKEPSIRFVW